MEENPEPDIDTVPEPDGEELPEPDTRGIPEPEYSEDEIPEPDTDELLEKYGKEYAEDATLESYHTPKSVFPVHHEAKKPAAAPASQGQHPKKTVDDALFFPDKEPETAKPPVNKLRIVRRGIVLIAILAAVYLFGLPMLTDQGGISTFGNPSAVETTPLPEPSAATTTPPITTAPPSRAFVPLPTQLVPSSLKFSFQVQKNPVTSKISVIFTGSAGEGSISSADIRVTHTDGSVASGIILPLKGLNEMILDGSKETDRVEIIARMSSGETYRVYDDLLPSVK